MDSLCNDYDFYSQYDNRDVVVEHMEYYAGAGYNFVCGRSFLEICREMGLDKNNNVNISL